MICISFNKKTIFFYNARSLPINLGSIDVVLKFGGVFLTERNLKLGLSNSVIDFGYWNTFSEVLLKKFAVSIIFFSAFLALSMILFLNF